MTIPEDGLKFSYKGVTMTVPKNSTFVPYATFFAGEYDFLNSSRKDIIIDAGANIGDYSIKASSNANRVIAIEPFDENIRLLRDNTKTLSNIEIIESAIGKENSNVKMSGRGAGANINKNGVISVKVDTLDSICDELEIIPTLLKMDIEGYECDALLGFLGHLNYVRKIVIEIHSDSNKECCQHILSKYGFKIRFVKKSDIIKRTLKNVITHPVSFLSYDKKNDWFATKAIFKYPITRISWIPSCGERKGMYLLEAWK